MGKLIDGKWVTTAELEKADTNKTAQYVREESAFRRWVTADGVKDGFKAEAGRYHLYASYGCPWANRTTVFRAIKGLEQAISISYVDPLMEEDGWTFGKVNVDGVDTKDPLFAFNFAHQIYTKADPNYSGRVTVPILWDKQQNTIVSNESAEIIRMFNSEFKGIADPKSPDFYPEALQSNIDGINEKVYSSVNNGVYRVGFAKSQEAYNEAVSPLFDMLDELDALLAKQPYLVGDTLTEADWRLFTTLIRFDVVYFLHFKCNKRQIREYPHLYPYLKKLYNYPGVKSVINFEHMKQLYYRSHPWINPSGIVPAGPAENI